MNPRGSRAAGSRSRRLKSSAVAPPPRPPPPPPPAGGSSPAGGASAPRPPWPRAARRLQRSLRRDDAPRRRGPAVPVPALDRVLAHPVDVEQEVLTVPGGDIEHRPVGGQGIVDRLAEVPPLRLDRSVQVRVRKLPVGKERNRHRRRVPDRLGQQSDHVVKVHGRPKAPVPPGRVTRALAARDARFPLRRKAAVHGGADEIELRRNERVVVVVERIAKWRREHHRAGGSGLVMVVHDLREPLVVEHAIHVRALGLTRHVEVAIVVVPDVFLVQARDAGPLAALLRRRVPHVPARHQFHSVRVRVHGKDDRVVEDPHRLRIRPAGQLIHGLHQLMRAENLGRV